MDRVRIFDRAGHQFDEIRATVDRSWALLIETSAVFRVSVNDAKCNPHSLNYGNFLLVENSDGLPEWVGMMDGRSMERGAVIVNAFSPERCFVYRRGPITLRLKGTAGEVFAQMIDYINGVEETVLQVGEIESNVKDMQETLTPLSIIESLKRVVSRSGEGYRWRPEVVDGQLVIYGDWLTDLTLETGLILHDGFNINGVSPMTESSPINDVLAYGSGTKWTERLISIATDEVSRHDYGLRQTSRNISTLSQATLDAAASTALRAGRMPRPAFSLNALNMGDTFKQMRPGAAAALTRLVGIGFSGNDTGYETDRVRVVSMFYSPSDGIVKPTLKYEVSDE